jgi:type I restriction enzyme S subunit
MNGWHDLTLGAIADGPAGFVDGPFGSNLPASDYVVSGIPVIRGSNLSIGGAKFGSRDFVFVSEATLDRLKRCDAKPGDVIFTKKGTIGQTGLVPDYLPFKKFLISSNQLRLRVDPSKAIAEYVYYWVSSPESVAKVIRDSSVTGVPKTNLAYFRSFPIRLPGLDEQRAIARTLGAIDDKIEANRRMNATLEALARALFKSWFVDFDPVRAKVEGRDLAMAPDLAALFPDALVESALEEVPKGWRAAKFDALCGVVSDITRAEEIAPEANYIGLEHMPRRSIALSEWDVAAELESHKARFKRGDVLFGKLRPYFHKVGVAFIDGVCSTDIVVLRATRELSAITLMTASSEEFVAFNDVASTGTKMPRTSWARMREFNVTMPDRAVAAAFQAIVEPQLEMIRSNVLQSKTLAALRDLLLPRLLSGALRVRDAERLIGDAA